MSEVPSPEQLRNNSFEIGPNDRIKLGDDAFAVCGYIDLAGGKNNDARVVILDVGFKPSESGYGPYDVDGSGETRFFSKPYVLVKRDVASTETGKKPGLKFFEVDDDSEVELGRETEAGEQLGITSGFVSRRHAKVSIGKFGLIMVTDLDSTNGTVVKSAKEALGQPTTDYNYTFRIGDAVHKAGRGDSLKSKEEAHGWGHGEYAGRPIIARDTPINHGVYPVGGKHGEALVIDDKKYPEELNSVYDKLLSRINQVSAEKMGVSGLRRILKHVEGEPGGAAPATELLLRQAFAVVYETLQYDLEKTNKIATDYQKVALNVYINEGVGVCRTQAVLAAYLIERLVGEGKLEGRVSVDRNTDHAVAGGHAWARFTNNSGEVFIIDPSQKYVGKLTDTYDKDGWDYRRSEDIVTQLLVA